MPLEGLQQAWNELFTGIVVQRNVSNLCENSALYIIYYTNIIKKKSQRECPQIMHLTQRSNIFLRKWHDTIRHLRCFLLSLSVILAWTRYINVTISAKLSDRSPTILITSDFKYRDIIDIQTAPVPVTELLGGMTPTPHCVNQSL